VSVKAPPLTEAHFQDQVTQLATLLGWSWVHFRPAYTGRGVRTPVAGPLGKGWPDLVLVHPAKGRVLFVELKRDGAELTPEQLDVLRTLESVALARDDPHRQVEVHVWRPRDWDYLEHVLR
jgi:VRR-NUC domain-containing protein